MTALSQAFAPNRRLGTILKIDAAFCAILALPALLAPDRLAVFLLPETPLVLGTPLATILLEIGAILALSAIVLLFLGTRPTVSRNLALLSAAVDIGLVAASALVLAVAGSAFNPWGAMALLVAAIDTGVIAWLKLRAARQPATMEAAA